MNTRNSTPRHYGRRGAVAVAAALVAVPVAGARPDPKGGAPTAPRQAEVVTIDRFDWSDAGMGAGVAAAGLIGLAALARPLGRRTRR